MFDLLKIKQKNLGRFEKWSKTVTYSRQARCNFAGKLDFMREEKQTSLNA